MFGNMKKALSALTAAAVVFAAASFPAFTLAAAPKKDQLTGKNLYCLVSPVSFSCGNLVPCIYKASGMVTLLGDTTGGGSCVVMPMSSAWGSLFQVSGTMRFSFVKNGSFYDSDRGVDPDIFLTKYDTFCNREKLTEIINGLY